MFLEQLGEGGNGDVERVVAVVLLQALDLGGRGEALCLLEILELGLRLGVEGVGERGKRALLRVVEEAPLLEEEREIRLPAHVVAHQLANLGGARVRNGLHLDELRAPHVGGRGRGEGALEVNVPLGHEPEEGLEGEDAGHPHERPFRRLDVRLVARGRQVDGGEGGP
jgi:hypothetical protein